MGFIYKITNDINNKIYIGYTTNTIRERFKRHKDDCMRYKRRKEANIPQPVSKLYPAMIKYGFEHFKIEILEEIESIQELKEQEIYYIDKFNSIECGYNLDKGGGGHHGHPWNYQHTIETDARLNPNQNQLNALEKGRHLPASDKLKQKLSDYRKNVEVSDETREKLRQLQLGKKCITNGNVIKYVRETDLDYYLSNGWRLGRK